MNEYFQHKYNTVKTPESRTLSTGHKGSKSTYNCPNVSLQLFEMLVVLLCAAEMRRRDAGGSCCSRPQHNELLRLQLLLLLLVMTLGFCQGTSTTRDDVARPRATNAAGKLVYLQT